MKLDFLPISIATTMLIKTRGIVLSYLKYRETSIIARVYTERLGVQSYVVNRGS